MIGLPQYPGVLRLERGNDAWVSVFGAPYLCYEGANVWWSIPPSATRIQVVLSKAGGTNPDWVHMDPINTDYVVIRKRYTRPVYRSFSLFLMGNIDFPYVGINYWEDL